MGGVKVAVVIDAPRDVVFRFVTDLRHDVHWYKGVEAVRMLSGVDGGVGTVYEQDTRMFGRAFKATMKVTEFEPPQRMTLVALQSLTPFVARYGFEETGPSSTRFTLDAEVTGDGVYKWFGPLFVPLIRMATAKRLRILKRHLENLPV